MLVKSARGLCPESDFCGYSCGEAPGLLKRSRNAHPLRYDTCPIGDLVLRTLQYLARARYVEHTTCSRSCADLKLLYRRERMFFDTPTHNLEATGPETAPRL